MRPFELVARVRRHHFHAYQEAVVAAEASDARIYRGRAGLLAREPDAVGPGERVLRSDYIRRLACASEEITQHIGVGVDRAHRAGTPLLLRQEGVEAAVPARG